MSPLAPGGGGALCQEPNEECHDPSLEIGSSDGRQIIVSVMFICRYRVRSLAVDVLPPQPVSTPQSPSPKGITSPLGRRPCTMSRIRPGVRSMHGWCMCKEARHHEACSCFGGASGYNIRVRSDECSISATPLALIAVKEAGTRTTVVREGRGSRLRCRRGFLLATGILQSRLHLVAHLAQDSWGQLLFMTLDE
jgi:hypothetical protein